MKFNRQLVLLETTEGTAGNEEELKKTWENRLEKAGAIHYKVIALKIYGEHEKPNRNKHGDIVMVCSDCINDGIKHNHNQSPCTPAECEVSAITSGTFQLSNLKKEP